MKKGYKKEHHRYKHYFLRVKSLYQQPAAKASTNLILTLLVISFFALFAIKPTLVTIAKLSKELKEKREVNRILAEKINNLNQAQTNYANIVEYLPLVDRTLPETADFNGLAARINFLTFSHDLVLPSASFEEFDLVAINSAKKNTIDFKISVVGAFANIKNFLRDLEDIDRIIQIDSITFSTRRGLVKKELQLELSGKAFWLARSIVDQKEIEP